MNRYQFNVLDAMETAQMQGYQRRSLRKLKVLSPTPKRLPDRLMQVLVIDNEPDSADELAWEVRTWGHTVRSAYDGNTALRIAAKQHPDVVLLNLDAPSLNWFAIATQLRRDFARKNCFVIALTVQDNDHFQRRCATAEIDLVLQHPLDLSVLETLLMLEGIRLKRSLKEKLN